MAYRKGFVMKKLVIVHGPMGVGKTAVCRALAKELQPSVWLDGDWCWQMQPFDPNEENREMVVKHIIYLLNSFLNNRNFSYVLFSWVVPEDKIFQKILPFLALSDVEVHKIALLCTPDALTQRLQSDIDRGLRDADVLTRSLQMLPGFARTASFQMNTTGLTPAQTARRIAALVKSGRLA